MTAGTVVASVVTVQHDVIVALAALTRPCSTTPGHGEHGLELGARAGSREAVDAGATAAGVSGTPTIFVGKQR